MNGAMVCPGTFDGLFYSRSTDMDGLAARPYRRRHEIIGKLVCLSGTVDESVSREQQVSGKPAVLVWYSRLCQPAAALGCGWDLR